MADDHLTSAGRAERGSYVSCIAGALTFHEYREGLAAAGFTDIEITPTQQVADGMHSAIIRATKSAEAPSVSLSVAAQSEGPCCGVSACCTPDERSVDPGITVADAKTAAGCGCQER
ncbi:hypothetical protein GCM10022267_35140 [Lentzea roselyniae]|uniref:Uncharacterized protein n=1 Tax=Lentzea roselyniae TaxID=531940 RepID=A0ABP7B1W3_9PSEU